MIEKGNRAIDILIKKTIENKDRLTYINLDQNNSYKGWVSNFNIVLPDNKIMRLDLKKEEDLFLLFAIASAWSRTGSWENATYFVAYLKYNGISIDKILNEENLSIEIINRKTNAKKFVEKCSGVIPRKKIGFRCDFYNSIYVLANNWKEIKGRLKFASENNDYYNFINYMYSIKGLGSGTNSMLIKIPLILRELRCQKVFDNIPGKYCCVVDKRVKENANKIHLYIPNINSVSSMLKASEIVYDNFGELYDIALFAYDELY